MASAFQAINRSLKADSNAVDADDVAMDESVTSHTEPATASVSRTVSVEPAAASAAASDSRLSETQDTAITDATTYGTRSRNRTGNARPNYSEDQEYDYDFVSSAATTTTTSKKSQQNTPTSNGSATATGAGAKRTGNAHDGVEGAAQTETKSPSSAQAAKDASTGASTSAASNPKKRKAASTNAQNGQTSSSVASSATGSAALRKTATTASAANARDIAMMTFVKSKALLNKKGELVADDGTKLCVDDHVYLVCEPPGDPYYLCRIMEFLHTNADDPASPIDSLRVNWYYRPRDVQRFNSDTRLVYATMHSDFCPITSLRGRCTIKHRSEIKDLDAYRKERDSFYYIQVFDRFIRRWYECIPTSSITNVPEKVKKALDERWKFVAIEMSRVKELTSAVKTCKRCVRYCASSDSVDCAICGNSYHMNCVQPPLPKKPSRGFAWACGPCSRASEQKREAQHNTPTVSGDVTEAEEEIAEDEDAAVALSNGSTRAPSPDETAMEIDDHPATQAEIELAKMWPMRYLGIHCRVEDALQYDDRAIYPRASSRLGPRHQATVLPWYGRPVELIKSSEVKKKYMKGGNQKDKGKLAKETIAAIEAERLLKAKRPKWVQDEPAGYVARGEDYPNDDPRCTAKLIFKMPEQDQVTDSTSGRVQKHVDLDRKVTNYVKSAQPLSRKIGVPPFGVNFLDKMMEIYCASDYNDAEALAKLAKVDRVKDMHEPVLSKADLVKFEEGVAKYGSEHRLVRLHMKTNLPHAAVVRFYYLWKKTPKGKEIWGNYPGRKGKKKLDNDSSAKLHEEVAHDADDSAFDNDKAGRNKRAFQCKFCNTVHSRQWRRAPGVAVGQTVLTDARTGNKDKKERLFLALCLRCANLWRKYAIEWEDIEEVNRKAASSGGKGIKRRIDEELLREQIAANEAANATPEPQSFDGSEPAKKKSKVDSTAASKKALPIVKPPTPEPPPIVPSQPQWRVLPCSVCRTSGDTVVCVGCKLTVHRSCYGLPEVDLLMAQGNDAWTCDQCQNDRNPTVSTEYSCCLCLTEVTDIDLVEPPKVGHKKKSDRDKEKERLEKELADAMRAEYTNKQLLLNRPVLPREPLKKTTGNNWVHVYCAIWTPEIRFSNAKALEVAEGFQLIPPTKHEAVCKLCKNKDHQNKVRNDKGACVTCFQCQTPFHVSCAFEAGYQFGFDVAPVKGSRKDQVPTATLGQESGLVTPAVWCKEHVVKNTIHPMHEIADETGKTALQVYVENYKQADLTLTGTVRKAQLAQLTKDKGQLALQASQGVGRRESAAHSIAAAVKRGSRQSVVSDIKPEDGDGRSDLASQGESAERRCVKCNIDVTPRWHETDKVVRSVRSNTSSFAQRPLTIVDMTSANGQTNGLSDPSRPGYTLGNGSSRDIKPPHAPGTMVNGTGHASDPMQIDSIAPSKDRPAVQVNGESRSAEKDYLCHKCFVKNKLDPTPPPEVAPPRVEPSPSVFSHWSNSPAGRPPNAQPQHQHVPLPRSPWEEQTRPSQAPPPPAQNVPMNPYARSPRFASSVVPPHGYTPAYHPQNAFAGIPASASPPLPLVPPPPHHDGRQPPHHEGRPPPHHDSRPPPLHDNRQPSLHDNRQAPHPYHGPPHGRAPSYGQHRPPPLSSGYLPSGSPLPNGTNEPRPPQHAPMRSPTYPPSTLQSQHNHYAPRRTESPFPTQLPSLGPPANSNPSPTLAISRPDSASQGAPPANLIPLSHGPPNLGASPVKMPQVAPSPAPRDLEGTPKPSSASTGANASGASASPSLKNLLS